ncbi:MAG TPA: Gfo/Idh/MocA family oxidoreductase [Bryobacteraceae bacterium]|nr:Gfo/Idh/MocA family oxidoreductase [Bryobacteraceae bacterium]
MSPPSQPRIAVIGAGAFGKNHLRVIHQSEHATLSGVLDSDSQRAQQAAALYGCPVFSSLDELAAQSGAAVVVTPTVTHADIGCRLMQAGLDVLVEKPMASDLASARSLLAAADRHGRILQVGHLERFNPAVIALEPLLTKPLFFEVHRLSEFSPRSLDVDVVLDLMIHDLDIVLSIVGKAPEEVRAAGISILSSKVDIANVRLQFPGGVIANLTASRVSTERVRKLRLFQPHEYISLDYSRQDGMRFRVKPSTTEAGPGGGGAVPGGLDFGPLAVTKDEPLRLELEDFFQSIVSRCPPRVTGAQGYRALEAAQTILDKIEEHSQLVAATLGTA